MITRALNIHKSKIAWAMLAGVAWFLIAPGCAAVVGGLAGAGTGYVAGHEAGEEEAREEIERSK